MSGRAASGRVGHSFSVAVGRRLLGKAESAGGNVKILLPETEPQGLAGSGEQREVAAGRPEGEKWRPLKTPSTT